MSAAATKNITQPELASGSNLKPKKASKSKNKAVVNDLGLATSSMASKAVSTSPEEAATLPFKGKGRAKAATVEDGEESSAEKSEAESSSNDVSDSDMSDPSDFEGSGEEDAESLNARRDAKREKRRIEDKKQAAILHNEGIANYTETRKERQPPQPRPVQVEKLWREGYVFAKRWWAEGSRLSMETTSTGVKELRMPAPHKSSLKKLDAKIEKYCEKMSDKTSEAYATAYALYNEQLPSAKELVREANQSLSEPELIVLNNQAESALRKKLGLLDKQELLNMYRFPQDFLFTQIMSLGKMLTQLSSSTKADSSSNGKDARLQKKFLRATMIFMDTLHNYNIKPADITSSEAMGMFQTFASSSDVNRKQLLQLKADLDRPPLENVQAWDAAARPMFKLLEYVEDTEIMRTEQATKKVDALVKEIKGHNTTIQLLNIKRGVPENVNSIPMGLLCEISDQWKNDDDGQVAQNRTKLMEQLQSQEPAAKIVQALESGKIPDASETSTSRAMFGDSGSNALFGNSSGNTKRSNLTNTEILAKMKAEKAQSRSRAPEVDLDLDNPLSFDLDSITLQSDNIEIASYEEGKTEFGPLVATRACRTDNPRFSRFILNSGTGEAGGEFYVVVKGSDLAPGAAEKLEDQKAVDFNLRQRKKDLKEHPLERIGPCIEMARSENYVSRGAKARKPDTYIRVTYRGKPEEEFLCRSEFIQLAGQRFAERHFAVLIPAYRKRKLYFEACRAQRRHPLTKKPLTSHDFNVTPWLFPEDERLLNRGTEGRDQMDFDRNAGSAESDGEL